MPPDDAAAEPDAGGSGDRSDADDGGDSSNELPEQIRTRGAEFSGAIGAGERFVIALDANGNDKIVAWLRQDEGTQWLPFLAIRRPGESDALVFSRPRDGSDAHIPYRSDELAEGWEFWYGGEYEIVLENQSQQAGRFHFSLECLAGPCTGDATQPGDFGDLRDGALRQAIKDANSGHIALDYTTARRHMFRTIDNEGGEVECVYTGTRVPTNDIPDHTYMNTEHIWPQSRGATGDAKSDLHHLFPALTEANDTRGSLYFGDVTRGVDWSMGGSKRGEDGSGQVRFEVRDATRGDIARAIFYFAVTYDQRVPAHEESTLRRWHQADPVDDAERARNDAVGEVQNSRNPFVDFPELVGRISDF